MATESKPLKEKASANALWEDGRTDTAGEFLSQVLKNPFFIKIKMVVLWGTMAPYISNGRDANLQD
jgi:hypothetical protein